MGKDPDRSATRGQPLSVAVLAGGESRRMGTDKALIDIGGEPMVVRVARRLIELSDDVFIVCKTPLELDVPEVLDEFAERTPLSGVITALHAAKHPLVFVCACDMPAVSPDLAKLLASMAVGVDVAAPIHDGQLEPLHAVWSVAAIRKLEAIWDEGERSVRGAIRRLDVEYLEGPDQDSFKNINTPEELETLTSPK